MAAATTDLLMNIGLPGTATTLAAPGFTTGVSTGITVGSTTNWSTTTGTAFAIDRIDSSGVQVPGSYCEFTGVVAGATSITNMIRTFGTAQNYAAGATTRVYIPVSATRENNLVTWGLVHANQDGSLKTAAVQTALGLGAGSLNGWNALGYAPNSVTANGNRSYTLTFNGVDLTPTLSAGMRLRTTRTVAAPTQSTSLNGTTQYYSKTAPAGMTFTDTITVMGWIKPTAYGANAGIISRSNGTNGWELFLNASGQVELLYGTGSKFVNSYQSVPLNKWTHVAISLTGTTGVVYIDGVVVPSTLTGSGTLTQAGNLEVGSFNATAFFPGKLAQVAVFSAVLSQATIQSYMSQGLLGTETSLISAYSFNNSINDLNTTNANNLTPNGSAVATNADSPYGGQVDGTISSTLDYAIVQKATFSTNTTLIVQVPEGCTIPTIGGVASVVYSSNGKPYGMPPQIDKWTIESNYLSNEQVGVSSLASWFDSHSVLNVPIGSYSIGWAGSPYGQSTVSGLLNFNFGIYNGVYRDPDYNANAYSPATTIVMAPVSREKAASITAPTTYTFSGYAFNGGGSVTWNTNASLLTSVKIFAKNTYL